MDGKSFENIKKKLRLTDQGVSDVMGISLCTVQNWANDVWLIPIIAERFLYSLLSMRDMEAQWMAGYTRGLNAGLREGRPESEYNIGYKAGYLAAMDK